MSNHMNNTTLIIDFDSTFIKIESLDKLAEVSLENHPDKDVIVNKISSITDQGMNGDISFAESLSERIALLKSDKTLIAKLVEQLKEEISDSFVRNRSFVEENADDIYIVSSGFKEIIAPVVAEYNIEASHVYANTFEFDNQGNIIGVDNNNPLAGNGGKIKVVKSLNLANNNNVIAIGDGYTDYEIKKSGMATIFCAFTENISRDKVTAVADHITNSFDQIITLIK